MEERLKKVPKLRFKDENGEDFPAWEEKKLGEVAEITNGNSDVQDASVEYYEGAIPFFDRSEEIKYLDQYLFDEEALIYPGEGKEFFPRYYRGKYGLHQRCYTIHKHNENIVNLKYLYYFLYTQNTYFQRFAVGSTVPSLRLNTFIKANIYCPSIREQTRIADFFTKLDEQIEVEQAILEKWKLLKKGFLQQMFI